MASVQIANACADERGKYSGGSAGDQTGKELKIQNWYAYPGGWNTVIRPKENAVAEKISLAITYACKNPKIGYDQGQRTTLFDEVAKLGWTPASLKNINTACETDCSALVAVCVNAALGYAAVSKYIYTGNEAAALMNTGRFSALTSSVYTGSSLRLKKGDILINTVHHTAVVVSDGEYADTEKSGGDTVAKASVASGVQTYKNGSTTELVYQTSALNGGSIGSLDPYESCYCFGKVNGAYLVAYQISGGQYKAGYVSYSGGTTF